MNIGRSSKLGGVRRRAYFGGVERGVIRGLTAGSIVNGGGIAPDGVRVVGLVAAARKCGTHFDLSPLAPSLVRSVLVLHSALSTGWHARRARSLQPAQAHSAPL